MSMHPHLQLISHLKILQNIIVFLCNSEVLQRCNAHIKLFTIICNGESINTSR